MYQDIEIGIRETMLTLKLETALICGPHKRAVLYKPIDCSGTSCPPRWSLSFLYFPSVSSPLYICQLFFPAFDSTETEKGARSVAHSSQYYRVSTTKEWIALPPFLTLFRGYT